MIAHSSGDFNYENIHNHRLHSYYKNYIITAAEPEFKSVQMFGCYVATLCFCGGRKIQVRYIVCYKHNRLFFRRCRGEKCAVLLAWLQTDFSNVVGENNQTYLSRMLASVKRPWYLKLMQSFFHREKRGWGGGGTHVKRAAVCLKIVHASFTFLSHPRSQAIACWEDWSFFLLFKIIYNNNEDFIRWSLPYNVQLCVKTTKKLWFIKNVNL